MPVFHGSPMAIPAWTEMKRLDSRVPEEAIACKSCSGDGDRRCAPVTSPRLKKKANKVQGQTAVMSGLPGSLW